MEGDPDIVVSELGDEDALPEIPLRIVGFDETTPVFANDLQISIDPMSLQLVFTRWLPPPVLTISDQQRLAERGFAPVDVVARVIVPPVVVETMIRLRQERLDRQKAMAEEFAEVLLSESGERSAEGDQQ